MIEEAAVWCMPRMLPSRTPYPSPTSTTYHYCFRIWWHGTCGRGACVSAWCRRKRAPTYLEAHGIDSGTLRDAG